jgi:hypothetical protein
LVSGSGVPAAGVVARLEAPPKANGEPIEKWKERTDPRQRLSRLDFAAWNEVLKGEGEGDLLVPVDVPPPGGARLNMFPAAAVGFWVPAPKMDEVVPFGC